MRSKLKPRLESLTTIFSPKILTLCAVLLIGILAASPGSSTSKDIGKNTSNVSYLNPQASSAAYDLVASDGGIFTYGGGGYYGSTGAMTLNKPIVGMAATPDGKGYWLVAADGGIFTFGDAQYYGSTGAMVLNKPIVGMAATPDGKGYWLVAADGGVFTFGDAQYYGSTGAMVLNKPIVGMAATPDGKGYWLVAADGGIFTFGDAQYYGSTGAMVLNKPIVGMATDPLTGGYWLVASDGGIFSFNAPFRGSAGNIALNEPVVGMALTSLDPYASPEQGVDLSNFQCSDTPTLSSGEISVIEVNGAPFDNNPCLATQYQAATNAGSIVSLYSFLQEVDYSNTAETLNGPEAGCAQAGNTECQSYDWGYNSLISAVNSANAVGARASTWWLDVEVLNASPLNQGCTNTVFWGCDLASNTQVIEGAIAALTDNGIQVGLYSTALQWNAVTGGLNTGLPLWIAGAPVSSPTSFCGNTAYYFSGGQPWLVQVLAGEYGGLYDLDYAC